MASISVIIPVLNECASIESVIQHSREMGPCEIIVVDGGSTDETLARAQRADRILSTARGRSIQLNAGAACARGDVLLFLHADCWLEPAGYQELIQAICTSEVVWGGFEQIIDHADSRFRTVEWGNAWRAHRMGWVYGDQGLFVRQSTFHQLGGFPPLPIMEDLYLSKKLKRIGKRRILGRHLHVSPRRWERHGILRQTLRNWWFLARAHCGGSLETLSREYRDVR